MPYDAVVFDSDGVLVRPTTPETLRGAIRRAFAEHGVSDPPTETIDRLFGTTPEDLRTICEAYGIADVDAFWQARDEFSSAAQRAAIRRGEKTLYDDVEAVLDLPVPRAVVSNNQQATVSYLVDHAGIADRFDPVIGRAPTLDDLARRKPSPHNLERAFDALGVERPLYVGDSNVDLAAAEAAGVDSAFIRREHRADYVLEYEPTHEVSSLRDVAALFADDAPVASDD